MTTEEELQHPAGDEFHVACLLLSPTARTWLGDTLEALEPDDFYDPHLGRLWSAARTIYTRGERVTKRSLLAEADTPAVRARIEQISGEPVYPGKLRASIRAIKEAAQMRHLIQAAKRIIQSTLTAEDYPAAIGYAWNELQQLSGGHVPEEAMSFADLVEEFHKAQAGELSEGEIVPTPWDDLNALLTGGLHPGRSYIVAGRPGDGKSNLGLNIAAGAAEQGYTTLVISEEMSGLEVTGRLMAAGARAEYGEITRYSMSHETARQVAEYGETNRHMPLYVVDKPDLTIEYIAAVARSFKRTKGLQVLVVDYLQLLAASDRSKPREQQVSHISRSIKLLARDLGCSVITLAQLNRESVKANRRPTLADLRESGSIEQDADTVVLIHHDMVEDQPTGMVTLIVAKNRHGRKGDAVLRWRGHQARIGD